MKAGVQEIGRELLANGDTLRITKLGREYQVQVLHIDNSAPDVNLSLSKRDAYTLWSEIVRRDVLEID